MGEQKSKKMAALMSAALFIAGCGSSLRDVGGGEYEVNLHSWKRGVRQADLSAQIEQRARQFCVDKGLRMVVIVQSFGRTPAYARAEMRFSCAGGAAGAN